MTAKEKFYRAYMDFFETAERKRRWNLFDDMPWDKLSPGMNSEARAVRIETYCAEEMFLPDYTEAGNELLRGVFGLAWFQNAWSYEESRHGLVFREYLIRSGLRTQAQFDKLEVRRVLARVETAIRNAPPDELLRCAAGIGDLSRISRAKGSRRSRAGPDPRGDFLSGQPRRGGARRLLPRDDRNRDGRRPRRHAVGSRAS